MLPMMLQDTCCVSEWRLSLEHCHVWPLLPFDAHSLAAWAPICQKHISDTWMTSVGDGSGQAWPQSEQ